MELRLVPPTGRPFIEGYGDDGFRIGVDRYDGAVLILMDRVESWTPAQPSGLTAHDLAPLIDERPEIIVVGTGTRFLPLSPVLRADLKAKGIAIDAMATAAACRTYNILLGENRRVVAALLPAGDPLHPGAVGQ